MTKLQFGCGPNHLDGWTNLEWHQQDITKRLNFADNSVDYILAEHLLEHVTHGEALRFLRECRRILKPFDKDTHSGVVRIIVPSVSKIWQLADDHYFSLLQSQALIWWNAAGMKLHAGPITREDCVDAIVYCHGHKACWSEDILLTFLAASGLTPKLCNYRESSHPELNDVDSHWKLMGLENCILESIVAEGVKP